MSRSLVLMVAPDEFYCNPVAKVDNHFMHDELSLPQKSGEQVHLVELRRVATALQIHGVECAFVRWTNEQGSKNKPDSMFPNNSISFHISPEGTLGAVLYPMSAGRKDEIPSHILKNAVDAQNVIDWRTGVDGAEGASMVLEGTGAINFSHDRKAVFICSSQRATEEAVERLIAHIERCRKQHQFSPFAAVEEVFLFLAVDRFDRPIYHTNVVGWVGENCSAWCFDAMRWSATSATDVSSTESQVRVHRDKEAFVSFFSKRNISLVELSYDEMENFAGNALEVFSSSSKRLLTMSGCAWAHLSEKNKELLIKHYGDCCHLTGSDDSVEPKDSTGILAVDIPTIERLGGGSVRCLQAAMNVSRSEIDLKNLRIKLQGDA